MNFKLKIIIKMLILIICSYIIWYKVNFIEVLEIVKIISLKNYTVCIIVIFFAVWLNSYKWHVLIPHHGTRKLFLLNLIAQFYALIFLGQLMGDSIKTVALCKENKEKKLIIMSTLMDKLTGLVGLWVVGFIGLLFSDIFFQKVLIKYFLIFFALLMILLISFSSKKIYMIFIMIVRKKMNLYRKIKIFLKIFKGFILIGNRYLTDLKLMSKSILLGILYQLCSCLICYILSWQLGISVSFLDWCWILGVLSVIIMLPISFGGIGVREVSLLGLLGSLNVNSESALAISILLFSLQLVLGVAGGLAHFMYNYKN